ncbi:MAG TPA: hypothetical protein VGF29_16635, partial [Hyphomicrobiaceae bacterium]
GEQPEKGQHGAIPGVKAWVGRPRLGAGRRRLDQPGVTEQWQELACSPVLRPATAFFRLFPPSGFLEVFTTS